MNNSRLLISLKESMDQSLDIGNAVGHRLNIVIKCQINSSTQDKYAMKVTLPYVILKLYNTGEMTFSYAVYCDRCTCSMHVQGMHMLHMYSPSNYLIR